MLTTLKGKCLLDTNILVYAYNQASPFHKKAREIVLDAALGKFEAVVAQQNLIEFCNVLTDQFHIPAPSVKKDLLDITADLSVIHPLPQTILIFADLLTNSKKGQIFDLYLAATMLDNDIDNIITLNNKDFEGVKGIAVFNPWQ